MSLSEFLLARIAADEVLLASPTFQLMLGHARWAAECAAKRQIVERHAPDGGVENWMDDDWRSSLTPEEIAGHCSWCTYDDRTVTYPCPDLRVLAAVYADHADYDEAWRP